MDINATIIGQSIAMIVFVWFCMKYIWPPVMHALEEALRDRGKDLSGTTVALQGFGNVGSHAAQLIADNACANDIIIGGVGRDAIFGDFYRKLEQAP